MVGLGSCGWKLFRLRWRSIGLPPLSMASAPSSAASALRLTPAVECATAEGAAGECAAAEGAAADSTAAELTVAECAAAEGAATAAAEGAVTEGALAKLRPSPTSLVSVHVFASGTAGSSSESDA